MSQSLDRPLESPRHRRTTDGTTATTTTTTAGGGGGGFGRGGRGHFNNSGGGGGRDGSDSARGRGGRDFVHTRGGRSRGRGRGRGHFSSELVEGGGRERGGHFAGRSSGRDGQQQHQQQHQRGGRGRGRFHIMRGGGGGRGGRFGGHDEDGSVTSRFSEDNNAEANRPVVEEDINNSSNNNNNNNYAAGFSQHDHHVRAGKSQLGDGTVGGGGQQQQQHNHDIISDTHRPPFHSESANSHRNVTQPPGTEIRPIFSDEGNSIHRGFSGNQSLSSRPNMDESGGGGTNRGTYGEILSNEQHNFTEGRASYDSNQNTLQTRDQAPLDEENSRVAQFDSTGRGRGRGRFGAFDGRGRGRNFEGNGRGRGRYIDRDGRGRMGNSRGGGRDGRGDSFAFGRGRMGDVDRNDRWQGRGHDLHTTKAIEWQQQNRTEQPSSYASIAGSDDAEPGEWRENDRTWNEEYDHRSGQFVSDGDRQQGNHFSNFANNKKWDTGRNSFQRESHRNNVGQQHGNRNFQQQDWKQEPREANYTTMADSTNALPPPPAPPPPRPALPESQQEGQWHSHARGKIPREGNEWNTTDGPPRENANQEWVHPRVNLHRDSSYSGLVGNDGGWKQKEVSTDFASQRNDSERGWNQQERNQSSGGGWNQHDSNQGSGNIRYQTDIARGSPDRDGRSGWNNRASEFRDGNYDDAFSGAAAASTVPGLHYGPASEAAFPPPTIGGGRGRIDDGRGRGRERGGRTFEGRGGYDRGRGRGTQSQMLSTPNDGVGMSRKRDFDNRGQWESFQQGHEYTRNDSFEQHKQDEKRIRENREAQIPIDSPVEQTFRQPQPPPQPAGPPPPLLAPVSSWSLHPQQMGDENDRSFPSSTPGPQSSPSESYEQSPLTVPLFRENSNDFNSFQSNNSRGGRGGRFLARGFDRGGNRGRGRHFAQDDRGGRSRGFDGRGYADGRVGGYGRGNYGPEGRGFQGRGFAAGRHVVPLPPPQEWHSSGGSYASFAALATQPPTTPLEDVPVISSSEQEIAKPPTPPPPVVRSPSPPPPPPSPPPEPVPPSSFVVSLARLVEAESQLDYALAKHLQLVRKRKLLRAQIEKLESLPIGAGSFKADLDKLIADRAQSEQESARRRKQEADEEDDLYAELDGDGS